MDPLLEEPLARCPIVARIVVAVFGDQARYSDKWGVLANLRYVTEEKDVQPQATDLPKAGVSEPARGLIRFTEEFQFKHTQAFQMEPCLHGNAPGNLRLLFAVRSV